jgi:mono/diheme cytochrome c family protein
MLDLILDMEAAKYGLLTCFLGVAAICAATSVQAGDVEAGRRIAQSRCASCHTIAPWLRRDELADAPPFELIARKFAADPAMLIFSLAGPHRKMNFRPTQGEMDDLAEYIRSLAH